MAFACGGHNAMRGDSLHGAHRMRGARFMPGMQERIGFDKSVLPMHGILVDHTSDQNGPRTNADANGWFVAPIASEPIMTLSTAEIVVEPLMPCYAGAITHRVRISDQHACEVGCLSRRTATHERLLLRAAPGEFCIVVPLEVGAILNAWRDRCPEELERGRTLLHAFDLRYAWSLQHDFPRGALLIKAPCEAMTGWWGTERSATSGAGRQESSALTIVLKLCQAVAGLLRCGGPAPERVVEHLVQAIFGNLRLGLCDCATHPRPSKDRFAGWQEQRVRAYIAANLTNKLRLSDVSGNCGMSCSHFSRLFKNTFGITLHQWIIEQRISEARRLLRDTPTPIADIAVATGFADQAQFSRVFSRTTRTTPMSWRRESRFEERLSGAA
jgi:AraC-like DNA-binding protein